MENKTKAANSKSNERLVHNLDSKKQTKPKMILGVIVLVVLGIFSGYGLNKVMGGSSSSVGVGGSEGTTASGKKVVVGSTNQNSLRDSAQGELEEGGLNGEGTHKLIRPGGDSQTVYLTSSMLDLSPFVGKKVKVSGETIAGKTAGWLMDVGKVEVLE
jgi:hypothetical protein